MHQAEERLLYLVRVATDRARIPSLPMFQNDDDPATPYAGGPAAHVTARVRLADCAPRVTTPTTVGERVC